MSSFRFSGCVTLVLLASACGDSGTTPDSGLDQGLVDAGEPDLGPPDLGDVDSGPENPWMTTGGGTNIGDVAGDLTLPTTTGDFSLSGTWDGDSSYVFVDFLPGNGDSDALFNSNIAYLVYPGMPPRAHYVFLARTMSASAIPAIAARADAALADLPPEEADAWRAHLHFVTADGSATGTWLDVFLGAHPVLAFAIDRFQKLRNVGSLAPFTGGGFTQSLSALRFEPAHFDFEYERERRLAAEHATIVTGVTALTTQGERWSWSDPTTTANEPVFFDATFPAAATMAGFDTLEVDLEWTCVGHDEQRCNEWDRLLDLYLCPDGMSGAGCGTRDEPNQIARWITSYHREGRWVTDISAMLPRFLAGGSFHFYLNTPQVDRVDSPMILDIRFRLSNQGKPDKPFAMQPLFTGDHGFDATYDGNYPDTTFTAPSGATRAEVVTILTGHGQNSDNCAEFCNHQHLWSFNGAAPHMVEFTDPDTSTLNGCSNKVNLGVLPNQFGTWNIGRAAWCPGFDVAPIAVDVTPDVHLDGSSNAAHYEARFHGAPYAGPSGASITMASFVVFYR